MNEQQLQQILTIQQAIAAAATAAMINTLLNPQQAAANIANNHNPADSPTLSINVDHLHQQDNQQHQSDSRQDSPMAASSPTAAGSNQLDANNRTIQELLLQLQQQQQQQQQAGAVAGLAQQLPGLQNTGPLNFNLNNHLPAQLNLASSPISRLLGQNDFSAAVAAAAAAVSASGNNTSLTLQQQQQQQQQPPPQSIQSPNHLHSNKKLKQRHNHPSPSQQQQAQQQQQAFSSQPTRSSLDATSKPMQHSSSPKNHQANANQAVRNNSNSTSSSAFLPNNVGLPRKLVRGQDVWLGRGAEQTRQILKCMWCGQSFRTLAEMTQHMKITQHYTNIISQEQITSWKQPEGSSDSIPSVAGRQHNKQSNSSRNSDDIQDLTSSDKLIDSDQDESFSNDDESSPATTQRQRSTKPRLAAVSKSSSDQSRATLKRDLSICAEDSTTAHNQSRCASASSATSSKPTTRSRKRQHEDGPEGGTIESQDEDDASPPRSPIAINELHQRSNKSDASDDITNEKNKCKIESPEDYTTTTNLSVPIGDKLAKYSNNEIKVQVRHPDSDSHDEKLAEDDITTNGDEPQIDRDVVAKTEQIVRSIKDENFDDEHEIERHDEQDNNQDDMMERDQQSDNEDESASNTDNNDECDKPTTRRAATALNKRRLAKVSDQDPEAGNTIAQIKQASEGQKSDGTGDPLSALETMVEKSFDSRMRPGLSSGGILQRLGIDEEVCPPWQHINYANWYAAAAYGHPMAAALLAAGINLQNGIKLSKNMNQKKNDD